VVSRLSQFGHGSEGERYRQTDRNEHPLHKLPLTASRVGIGSLSDNVVKQGINL